MTREIDYGITTLNSGDLWKLLPATVRAKDGGAIRTLCQLLELRHNEFVKFYRALPRLIDPTKAGQFSPADFKEDQTQFDEWQALKIKASPTTADEARASQLEQLLPYSTAASKRETTILLNLLKMVGDTPPDGVFRNFLRELISSNTPRRKLKGSKGCVQLLTSSLGLCDVIIRELWTSTGLSGGGESVRSGVETFLEVPEEYPLWDVTEKLLVRGNEVYAEELTLPRQLPQGSADYTPLSLVDGGSLTLTYRDLSTNPLSIYSYRKRLDGNPFGWLRDDVIQALKPGTYYPQSGVVTLPYANGGSVRFISLVGVIDSAYSVQISGSSKQTVILSGLVSKIRYKSSKFNVTIGLDVNELARYYEPVITTEVADATPDDGDLGRTPPDYPVTGSATGERRIAEDLKVFDRRGIEEASSAALSYLYGSLPLTREAVQVNTGLLMRDSFRYAPYIPVSAVTLAASDGSCWKLSVDGTGGIYWNLTSEAATAAPIQYDNGVFVQWSIRPSGRFGFKPTQIKRNDVVFLSSSQFAGFILADNGALISDRVREDIPGLKGDGTTGEAILSPTYGNIVETLPAHLKPFMSEKAFPDVTTPATRFQTRPEDELTVTPVNRDQYPMHLALGMAEDPNFKTGERINLDGTISTRDFRQRHCGIEAQSVSPVPTGSEDDEDGLTYDYPVGFLDYSGYYSWRHRQSNAPYRSYYTYAAESADAGPTLHTEALTNDGPIEGTNKGPIGSWEGVPETGFRVTPNAQVSARPVELLWKKADSRTFSALQELYNPENNGGRIELDGLTEPKGTKITILGAGTYTHVGGGVLATSFVSSASVRVFARRLTMEVAKAAKVTLLLTAQSKKVNWRVGVKTVSGDVLVGSGSTLAGNESEKTITLPNGSWEVWLETTGGTGSATMTLNTDYPDWSEFGGSISLIGGERDAVEYNLVDPGETWRDYRSGERASTEPLLGGKKWYRGGDWAATEDDGFSSSSSSSSSSQSSASSSSSSVDSASSSSGSSASSWSSQSSNSSSGSSLSSPSSFSSASSESSSSSGVAYAITDVEEDAGAGLNLTGEYYFTAATRTFTEGLGADLAVTGLYCPSMSLSPSSLTAGTVGVPYSVSITSSAGTAPITFAVISGSAPPGITLDSAGLLSGTPTTAGSYSFSARATDAIGCTGTRVYSLVINP